MSKQGNMETSNICATEDVFEQFVQDFESGEFITLSELVPSSYPGNEVMDTIIMEMPNGQTEDQNVKDNITFATVDQQVNVQEINPTSASGHTVAHNVMDNITFAADDQQENLQEINPTLPSDHTFAHNVMDNVTLAIEDQQVSIQTTSSDLPRKTYVVYSGSQSHTASTPKVGNKRGRKKKSVTALQNNAEPVDNSDLNFDMIIGEDDFPDPTAPTTPRKAVKSLKTVVVKTSTPNVTQKPISPKKTRGRPKKQISESSPSITTTSIIEPKKRNQRKRKADTPAPLLTSTIETKKNYGLRKKNDPNIHGVILNNENANFDITSSSIVDMKGDEFLNDAAKEVAVTNEETKEDVINNANDAVDMCSEIVGEVEIMTSTNDDDNIPLGQLSKVINKSVPRVPTNDYAYNKSIAEKTNEKEFITKNTKKRKQKKKTANVEDDGMDNVSLSKLKNNLSDIVKENDTNVNEQHPDITTTVQETVESDVATFLNDSKVDVSAETSKRPVRRRAKKILHYEQDSDEDPFANVELSDDEPSSGKKGNRYYSDDEYIPGIENGKRPDKFSDSEAEDDLEFIKNQKKRKLNKSPKKKLIADNVSANPNELEDDIEGCIETSVIKLTEGEQSTWGTTKEFENFLANKVGSDIFIKKSKSTKSQIAPLEIPVLDLNEPKKIVEISTQTNIVSTKNSSAQTDTQNEVSMVEQVKLTAEQSKKACEFLSNIVKTTAELGQLMTQKSEDFIEKKINTTHVTDTLKMDYCVKKSFLLFKLAKHNLIQMEEDLARQYEDFLNSQNLSQHREKRKVIPAKVKDDSDSDCEIVEVIADDKEGAKKKEQKPAFNPKTVFLNKELSIKIAKKPSTPSVSADPKSAKNINIKGRHTVWINDSIMVKKVKPNQSFLAQDSRNKKPPDSQFVTLKMVNDFFESYNRQKVLSICAPFVGCNWFTSNKSYFCYYSTELVTASSSNCTLIANNTPIVTIPDSSTHIKIPKPLLTLCVVVLKKLIKLNSKLATNQSDMRFPVNIHNIDGGEVSSLRNEKFTDNEVTNENLKSYNTECQINNTKVKSLSVLCLQELQKHIYLRTEVEANCSINSVNFKPDIRRYEENIDNNMSQKNNSNVESLTKLCLHEFQKFYDKSSLTSNTKFISNHRHTESIDNNMSQKNNSNVESLTKLCLHEFQKFYDKSSLTPNTKLISNHRHTESSRSDSIFNCYYNSMDVVPENESYVENNSTNQVTDNDHNKSTLYQYKHVNNLQTICHRTIVELIFENSEKKITQLEPTIINTYTLRPIDEIRNKEVKSLFSLCTRYIQNIQYLHYKQQLRVRNIPLYTPKSLSRLALKCLRKKMMPKPNSFRKRKQIVQVKTLSRLCLELLSSTLYMDECSISNKKKIISEYSRSRVLPLNKLCFEKITTLMGLPYAITDFEKKSHGLSITINEINTVSEDFFNNDYNSFDEDDAYDDTGFGIESNEESRCEMENNYNDWENNENIPNVSNEWAANIQMGDLRSCVDARKNNEDHATNTYQEETSSRNPLETGILSNIKQEPCEEAHYLTNIMTIIKNEPDEDVLNTEPLHGITKTEHLLHEGIENTESPLFHNGSSYDVNAFENFVSSNKLMYSLADGGSQDEEEVYGQSFPRVRRQYEPDFDSDGDNFDNLGLLIPQTVEQAKDKLMNSSSDEEGKTKKNDKRKYVKKKGKLKKPNKEIVPIKSKNADDVAVLTKKMKERLRQEDKQEDVSDEEDMPLILRKDKSKKMPNTDKVVNSGDTNNQDKLVEKEKTIDSQFKNAYEIQCNNIDSTENLETIQEKDLRRSLRKSSKLHLKNNESAKDDTNDCISKNIEESEVVASSQFQKLRDQENLEPKQGNNDLDLRRSLRKTSKVHAKSEIISEDKSDGSILKNNDVSEDVESSHKEELRVEESKDEEPKDEESKDEEPKDEESKDEESKDPENSEPESDSDAVDMAEPIELLECEPTLPIFDTKTKQRAKAKKIQRETDDTSTSDKEKSKEIVIRNGWECYPIDHSDTKLYEYACISLEKLPESFVDTYFKYINLDKEKDEDDIEIDKLTNLHTLNREKIKSKEVTRRSKTKVKTVSSDPSEGEMNIKIELEAETELSPSEDENDNTDDILPPPVQENDAENYLAKSLLMGDNDSETEDADGASQNPEESKEKRRPGPKSKTKGAEKIKVKQSPASIKKEDGADLLLTADRMMNSELALLHAPATGLTDQIIEETKDSTKKNKHPKSKTSSKSHTTTVHIRKDDDSSSEEEKQWVTTKEKLLKRLEKKQENHIDDAKRAKIVSEFIEKRREDGPVSQSVLRRPRRGRSNRKKLLERRKQMKVLSRELCGEDASTSKRYSQSYGKGRRNIRKVIDKKSLARNTVLANIEEFERKRRLCMREAQLKETLGFEEDVNVVVINDELCLEYDFDNNQPSVTVHPFFTKVMKAHQYEGVKFMWDACFETVETVQNGGKGGGCILAHCMGLGKTLQVLALLHTVLTHPGVAMQRVLVCCPLSTVLNWVDEIHKWIGPVTNQIKVFELSKLKKTYERAYQLEDWYNGGGIFIIGYELFRSLTTLDPMLDDVRPTIINKIRMALLDPGPDIIICDEGHLLKNDMSVLAVAMSRVVTKRRIVLTGTPMQNNLREYYCMVNFIKPNLLGTYSEYSNRFENPIMNGQHRDSREEDIRLMKQRTHILHKVLEGCLQRQEASVLYPYLPKKYEYTVFISLTSCQWDLYKHYIAQTKATCKGNKHGVLKDFHVLQKIWSHPQVLHHFQTRGREADEKIKAEKLEDELLRDDLTATEDIKPTPTDVWWLQYLDGGKMLDMLDSSNKFLVVFRLLDECVALGDKVLIFSTSLYALDALEYFLRVINGWSLGQDYYRLDGAVPPEVRQKWCREFNDESNTHTKLFLISTRAGCLGLNMTAANRVIILDTSWNPAHDIQSIFRVYRFGQKKDCFIYRLVALGTMEQKMYERSVTKQAVACRVVDEQQIDRHYNMAELSELYSYDEEGWSVGAGLAAGVRDAALLRVAAALQGRTGALHAVREHDSLLRDTDARLPEHERAAAWQQFQQEHAEEQPLVKIPKKFQLKVNESKERTPNILENTAESKPARKRGRPRKYSPERSEPSTSKTMNHDNAQEVIVDKIRELLIQHKAMDATPTDIAKMIGEVRKYIADPTMDISSNPLVEKIAEVLLRQNMPPLTDCLESGSSQVKEEPETILGDSDSITRDTRQEEHKIGSPSDSEATLSDTEFKDKKRKRSKIDDDYIPPQYYMYKMDDTSNISLKVKKKKEKRGRSRKNVENTPSRSVQNTRLAARNSKDVTEDTIQNIDDDNDNYTAELTGVHTIDDGINEDTIDISDDETVVAQTPAPSKRKKPPKTTNELPDDILLPSKATVESIPLPKSLLTDKKFIKIVAHMYVSSSPILDEDAATRAAEYSTSKALRELNETGENIVSGNLHEIALKVYGPEALKRLNVREAFEETKKKAADGTTESSQSSDSNKKPIILKKNKLQKQPLTQEKTTLNEVESSNTVEIEVAPKPQQEIIQPAVVQPKKAEQPKVTPQLKPSRLKVVVPPKISNTFQFRVTSGPKATQSDVLHIPTTSHNIVPTPVTEEIVQAPVTSPQRVVPVGMFTGAGTIAVPNSMEESILPDDDDIMVIPLNSTPQPEAPTTILSTMLSKPQDMGALLSKQKDTGRRQSQQLLINSVSTSVVNTTLVNVTLAHTTLANTMLTNYTLANTTLANTTLANATVANTTLANTMLANTKLANNTQANNALANTTITNTTLVNTTPHNTKPADTKKQASQIKLPKLAPAPPGTRTYLIKTSELEAALAKYPNGKGPTLHIDSGKVMVPVQIIKQTKQSKSTTTPTKTTNSIFIPHASAPHTKVTPNKSTAPNTPKTPIVYDPICLDSDDEDTNTNTVSGTKKPEPIKLDVRPTKNPETKQASSKADHRLTMKSEPKTPIQDSSKVDVKLSKPEKKTPDPGSVKLDKNPKSSLTDLKFKFDKYKKKIEISPTSINATAKEPEKPKKVADTKATETKSSRPGTVMFDNGASIEFVSLCENPAFTSTPTPNAKSVIGISFTNEKKTPEKPKTDTPKYKPKPKSKQTGPQINLGMIDLTSLEASEPKKSTKVIKPSSSKLISGTSKDIFITNAGKLSTDKVKSPLKNVDLTGGDVTNVVNIKPSTSTKRTKKPEISTPAKKPKVEVRSKPSSALKSLMDLTFDDIDDIVELE